MTASTVIEANRLNVSYRLFPNSSEKLNYLLEVVFNKKTNKSKSTYIHAIKNLDLRIKKGERIGIIGRNGAGKSTLIKSIIAAEGKDQKDLVVNGVVHNLMPGSISLVDDLSVKENAINILTEAGLTHLEIEKLVTELRDFLELGDYFFQPVKNLSLGMKVRSEFSVATVMKPDILLVDEAIGAGDIYWTEKLAKRMDDLCQEGVTLILVSHSIGQILRYCERAVWLEKGRIQLDGDALEVCTKYESFLETLSWKYEDLDDLSISAQDTLEEFRCKLDKTGQEVIRWPGLGELKIIGLQINGKSHSDLQVNSRNKFEMRIFIRTNEFTSGDYRILVTFWAKDGKRYAIFENDRLYAQNQADDIVMNFCRENFHLKPGHYSITISIYKVSSELSSIEEKVTRQDSIYKSINMELINDKNLYRRFKYSGDISSITKLMEK